MAKAGLGGNPFWWINPLAWSCPNCPVTFISKFRDLRRASMEVRAARDTHKCGKEHIWPASVA